MKSKTYVSVLALVALVALITLDAQAVDPKGSTLIKGAILSEELNAYEDNQELANQSRLVIRDEISRYTDYVTPTLNDLALTGE